MFYQANLLNEIEKVIEPLKNSKANLELLFKQQLEVSKSGLDQIKINADFLNEMSDIIYKFCDQAKMKILLYQEEN